MTKALGKNPPYIKGSFISLQHQIDCFREEKEHYRQALIEAADELEHLIPRVKGIITNPDHVRLCVLVKQIKKSAGVE